jgi:hypothetical protein
VVKHFLKTPLHKALASISGGYNLLIDVRVEKNTRMKVTADFDHVPIETVFELLADAAGLAVFDKTGIVYITTPANAERWKKEYARREKEGFDPDREQIGPDLLGKESWRKGITLHKSLTATAREGGVNLMIDPRVEKKTNLRVSARLFGPVAWRLELLADMGGLAVVKKANVYYVTSPDNAERLKKMAPPRPKSEKRPADGGL